MEKVKNVVLPNFLSQNKIVTFIELYFLLKSKNMLIQKGKTTYKVYQAIPLHPSWSYFPSCGCWVFFVEYSWLERIGDGARMNK